MNVTTGADRERYAIIESIERMARHLTNHGLPVPVAIVFDREKMERVRLAFGALGAQCVRVATSSGYVELRSSSALEG